MAIKLTLDLILGSYFMGAILNAAVWGVSCVQTYTFYMRNPGDRLFLKVLVGFLWCTNTFNLFMNVHLSHYYLIVNYGNPLSFTNNVWSLWLHTMSMGVMEFIIRSMFTRRVYLLSHKNKLLTTALVTLSLFALACAEYLGSVLSMQKFLTDTKIWQLGIMLHFSSVSVVEFSIAISLCYCLYKSESSFKKTNSIIHTLMLYSVNTGLVVFFISIATFITSRTYALAGIAHVMAWLVTKLYFCCYLASLNAREDFRRDSEDLVSIHVSQ